MAALTDLVRFRRVRLGMQRKLRSLRRRIPFVLGASHAIAISLISEQRQLDTAGLIQSLRLSKSRVSRLLQFLEERGCVVSERLAADNRKARITLSVLGDWLFDELNEVNDRIAGACLTPFAEKERAVLIDRVRRLATGLGAEPSSAGGASQFAHEITRLTRALGTVSGSYMQTGRSVLELQIFLALDQATRPTLPELAAAMPVDRSTTSRTVADLVKEGLIEAEKQPDRKGLHALALTAKGAETVARAFHAIDELHARALTRFPPEEIPAFIDQMEAVNGLDEENVLAAGVSIERCSRESDFHSARRLWVERLVQLGRHDSLGGQLLPQSGLVYIGKEAETITGIAEFTREHGRLTLANLLCEKDRHRFLYSAVRKAALESDIRECEICALPRTIGACYQRQTASEEVEVQLRAPYSVFSDLKEALFHAAAAGQTEPA